MSNKNNNFPPYKCKICGQSEIEFPFDICKVCGWEDDSLQNNNQDYIGGANKMSFNQYKQFWKDNMSVILKNIKDKPFIGIELSQQYYERNFKNKIK